MSDIRIDLLTPTEHRYQGSVSGRFIGFATSLSILLSLVLVFSYLIFSSILIKKQLVGADATWLAIKPKHMEYLRIKKITDDLNELATELDGWNESRTSWYSLLSKLQATLPENIQLTTMDINDKIIARKGTESGENTTELYRKFKIEINGYAHDPSSESTVVNFIDNVREANKTNKAFEKITLSSMGKNPNEEHVSFFVISIEGKERDLK